MIVLVWFSLEVFLYYVYENCRLYVSAYVKYIYKDPNNKDKDLTTLQYLQGSKNAISDINGQHDLCGYSRAHERRRLSLHLQSATYSIFCI